MAGKRGQNEGTITKRSDGRWEARVSLPDGSRKCFYGKTRRDVEKRLAEARRTVESGLPLVNEQQLVSRYLESWLETMLHVVKPRTFQRYKEFVQLHLIPHLGKIAVAKLTPQQLQAFYAQRLQSGLSPTTVHHIHTMLHKALANALRLGVVSRNVTELVDPPRMTHYKSATLSPEQARAFLHAVAGERFEALYVLALSTGMRQGELLGLRWADVDIEHALLHVRSTLQFLDGKFVFSEPKSLKSQRTISLTKRAVETLQRHRARQDDERLALGEAWDESYDLVFANTIGRPENASNLVLREFRPFLKKAEVPLIRFHDLRHTAATLLLRQGVSPKIVSDMLGHSTIAITLDVYSHVSQEMQHVAVEAMENLLGE